ncbi:MAG: hypothetical protein WC662_02120 [Candidatus Paceibacterota bacterium]|jgi:hypothetical protein
MLVFTNKEKELMEKLNTPAKVQDFLNILKFNFEKNGETLKSPIRVLREKNAHCLEGAIFGAYILSLHGQKPLLLHLETTKDDFDHVVALFQKDGFWGALSKTNHGVLRYREPIYKNIRELVMSYFHEYFLDNGKKTLRKYSRPLNLNIFPARNASHSVAGGEKSWITAEHDLWEIDQELDKIKHYDIAPKKIFKKLRLADKIEIEMGKIVECKNK